MLQKMRQNTKAILWVVVIAFVVTIFAVWGLDLQTGSQATDPNILGKVNGVAISRSQYQFAYQQFTQQMRSTSQNQGLTYAQEQFARNQAWDSIVYAIVTQQQIDGLGISVADLEIVDYLRNSPPVEIRQYFLDDAGEFDNQAYQTALNNPEIDWTNLEQLARERIQRVKLNEYLAAQVHVSEDEVRRAYTTETVDLSLEYVEFPAVTVDIGDYEPSEDELQQYYESHRDGFTETERSQLMVVRIPLAPGTIDLDDAVFRARRARDQIVAGEEFGELAKTYSDAPTSFVEGKTGFITRDQRESPYFDALDGMEEGELSDVITSDAGTYVLKLIEKRAGDDGETDYSVQEILIETVVGRQTSDSLFALAAEVQDIASTDGLEPAATGKQLEVHKPLPFPKGGSIETLGFVAPLSDFAFANDPGTCSGVLRDEDNLYIAEIVERMPERIKSLDEVQELVKQGVLVERKKAIADRDAQAFFRKVRSTDFQTAVESYGLTAKQTGTFKARDNLEGFGPNSVIAEIGLSIAPGQTSPPVEWRLTYYVVELVSRTEVDTEDYKSKIPSIRQRLLDQKAQSFSQNWYENLISEADIEDYRLNS
jgi:peptidyl-prolyl cis-trans isomerase D